MAIARKIAYNVVLNSSFKVFSTVVLSLFSIRLITEYLGPEGFGKYATVLAFFAFFSAIADLGLASVTAREISREGADEKKIVGNIMALRLMTSGGLVLLAPLALFFFQYDFEQEVGILIAATAILFSTTSLVLNGIFQKNLAMDKVAFVEFFGKFFQVALVLLIVKQAWGFLPIAATLLASLSFNALFVYWLSRRYLRFSLQFDFSYWKAFLRESYPMGITAIITFAYFKLDTILLSVMQSSADVGIYNVAYKILENLIFFPAMLVGLILPLLSRSIYTNREVFEEIADKTFKVFLLIVAPLLVGTWFLAADIVQIVSGSGFEASAPVLRILIFALGFIFFGHFFNMLLIVSNAQKKLMVALFFAAVFNVSLNLFLIPQFSYMGAAWTSLSTEALVVALTGTLAFRSVHFRPSLAPIWRILGAVFLMGGAIFFLEPYSFFLAGIVGSLVYVAGLWLTRAISYRELRLIFSNKEKEVVTGDPLTL